MIHKKKKKRAYQIICEVKLLDPRGLRECAPHLRDPFISQLVLRQVYYPHLVQGARGQM